MNEALLVIIGTVIGAVGGKLVEITIDSLKRRSAERGKLKVADWGDVQSWGWSSADLLRRLIKLDRSLYGPNVSDQLEGTVHQWAPIFAEHPESWALLIAGPKGILGYWHFVALTTEMFERAKTGDLFESEITNDTIDSLEFPGVYNMYISMIGTVPSVRYARFRLLESLYDAIEAMAARGVFFREICADAFTAEGEWACRKQGMKELVAHKGKGTIFSFQLSPWPSRLNSPRYKNLKSLYEIGLETERPHRRKGRHLNMIVSSRK